MKILMMTNTYTPLVGGLEKSIQTFSEAFRRRGHEVKIVAPEFENQPAQEKDVVRVPSLEKFVGTDFSVALPLPEIILDLVDNFKPDIVHSHHPFLMGDLALRLCGQKKIPLVFTYHIMFEYYRDHFAMNRKTMRQFVLEMATGYANMVDQVIAPSESVARLLRKRKVKTPIAVVPTGIQVQRFAPAPTDLRKRYHIPQDAFLVGHTGRLSPEKNLIFLTKAVAAFLKQNQKAHFLIVGDGPSESEMQKIFRDQGVRKKVYFAGVLKGRDLIHAYHAMNVFAFASQSETQGLVLTEAMAAGLPVVALDAPGVREVVKDKINGRMLTIETQHQLTSALAWCASRSPRQWDSIKKAALETVHHFSLKICADKALRVYEKVVRRQEPVSDEEWNRWKELVGRFKTELDMFLNIGRAAGAALVKTAVGKAAGK